MLTNKLIKFKLVIMLFDVIVIVLNFSLELIGKLNLNLYRYSK